MNATAGVLKLEVDHFPGVAVMCTGPQIAEVVQAVDRAIPSLVWYAADVTTIGHELLREQTNEPSPVGSAADLAAAAGRVDQFESGVFLGVPPTIDHPRFRDGGVWTDDEPLADLGDAIVEIRAFDTTFIEISSGDPGLLESLEAHFGKS